MSRIVTALVQCAPLPRTMNRRVERRSVLCSLAGYCDDQGRGAFPSIATQAGESDVGTTMVPKDLAALSAASLIRLQARARGRRANTWCLNLDRLAALIDPQLLENLSQKMRDDIWAAVRAEWTRVEGLHRGINITEEAQTGNVIAGRLLEMGGEIQSGRMTTAAAVAEAQRLIRGATGGR